MIKNLKINKLISMGFSRSAKTHRFLNFTKIVATVSVMLGVIALIVSMAILEGFQNRLFDSAVRFTSHIKINTYGRETIYNPEQIANNLRGRFSEIKSIYPVIEREAIVRSGDEINGIAIKGISEDYLNSQIALSIISKSDSLPENYIIIGEDMASKLAAKLGDKLIVYSVASDLESAMLSSNVAQYIVSGIYRTGMKQYDESVAFVNIEKAASLYGYPPNSSNIIELYVNDINQVQTLSYQMDMFLGYPYFTMTVFDLHNSIFAWIELQKEPIPLILGLISIVAVLNIITTLLITVVEKTHSIGVLRSLGLAKKNIIRIFVRQGLAISIKGLALGFAVSLLFTYLQANYELIKLKGDIYFLNSLPIEFIPWHYLLVAAITLFFAFLSTVIPAYASSKVLPIKAIRFR